MGYVEKMMGDREHMVYRTHQHYIVLLEEILVSLLVFVVFMAMGLAILVPEVGESGNRIRGIIGLIALGSLVMPLYLIVSALLRGLRGRELFWRIWWAALAGILILAFALIILFDPGRRVVGWIAIVVAVIPLSEVVRIFSDWLNERYVITNRRVMEVRGIINKHVSDSALEKVNDVQLEQSIVGRFLGYGTVRIITGSDVGVNMFRRISNPVRFKREMLNAKERLHESPEAEPEEDFPIARVPSVKEPAVEPATPPVADIPDLLVELDELRQKGIISEQEFQAKKKELLDRL
jgi:uncharacterized membrane protein